MKLQKLFFTIAACAVLGATFHAFANHNSKDKEVKFTVKVENVSSKDLQTASDGSKWPTRYLGRYEALPSTPWIREVIPG